MLHVAVSIRTGPPVQPSWLCSGLWPYRSRHPGMSTFLYVSDGSSADAVASLVFLGMGWPSSPLAWVYTGSAERNCRLLPTTCSECSLCLSGIMGGLTCLEHPLGLSGIVGSLTCWEYFLGLSGITGGLTCSEHPLGLSGITGGPGWEPCLCPVGTLRPRKKLCLARAAQHEQTWGQLVRGPQDHPQLQWFT